MLREYEFTFVTKAEGGDQDKNKFLAGYEEILKREDGALMKRSEWGIKRLAYPIKKSFKGNYVFYNVATVPDNIAECERLIKIDDNILRHLVIKVKDDVNVDQRTQELAKADAAAANQE